MKSRLYHLLILIIGLAILPVHDATPAPLPPLTPITLANVHHIKLLSHYGDANRISPDGKRAVIATQDKQRILIDIFDGRHLLVLGVNVTQVEFNATSTVLKGLVDNRLKIWDAHSGHILSIIALPLGKDKADLNWEFTETVFSPDGATLAAYFTDSTHTVFLWDTDSGTERFRIDVDEIFYQIEFSPDSRLIALFDSTERVSVWDIVEQKRFGTIETPNFSPTEWSHMGAEFSADSSILVLETAHYREKGTLFTTYIYDLKSQVELGIYQGLLDSFSASGREMVIISDTSIDIYDVSSGVKEKSVQITPHRSVSQITLSPDGTRLAYVERDSTGLNRLDSLLLWDITGGLAVKIATKNEVSIRSSLQFNPEGSLVLFSFGDKWQTSFMDAVTGSDLKTIPGNAYRFNADGTLLFSFDAEGSTQVWGIRRGSSSLRAF